MMEWEPYFIENLLQNFGPFSSELVGTVTGCEPNLEAQAPDPVVASAVAGRGAAKYPQTASSTTVVFPVPLYGRWHSAVAPTAECFSEGDWAEGAGCTLASGMVDR